MIIVDKQVFNEQTLNLAISLLSHKSVKGDKFKSYQELIEKLYNWTIFYLSPYEN